MSVLEVNLEAIVTSVVIDLSSSLSLTGLERSKSKMVEVKLSLEVKLLILDFNFSVSTVSVSLLLFDILSAFNDLSIGSDDSDCLGLSCSTEEKSRTELVFGGFEPSNSLLSGLVTVDVCEYMNGPLAGGGLVTLENETLGIFELVMLDSVFRAVDTFFRDLVLAKSSRGDFEDLVGIIDLVGLEEAFLSSFAGEDSEPDTKEAGGALCVVFMSEIIESCASRDIF